MNLTQFAKERNVKTNTISNYLSRHPEIRKHILKNGKEVDLTPEAIKMLDEVYPVPKPVQVINGVDPEEHKRVQRELEILHGKYESKLETILELQDKLNQVQSQIARAEATQLLLEDRNEQLKKEMEKSAKLQEELNQEKAKTWIQKFFGK